MFRDISERVSYLQGLSEGLNINDGSAQGKIISGILDVLAEMTTKMKMLTDNVADVQEYMDSMDEDLSDLQEAFWDQDDDYVEVECPECGENLFFESDVLDEDDVIEIICPRCNEVVFINDGSFDYEPSCIDDDSEADSAQPCCHHPQS